MKCKVTNYLVFALVLSTVLMSGLIVNAKKPLVCEKSMDMNLGAGPGDIMAAGQITGDINGWFVVYNLDPLDEMTKDQVTHYWLRWEIWPDELTDTPFMSGTHKVNSNNKKLEWVAQGMVEYVDETYNGGQYADLEGCIWHAKGIIDLDTFQIVDDYFLMNGPR
jgi:hypothetical protein